MKLNLSDEPLTAELLSEALQRSGSAVIAVSGGSMHPTLQIGWRVFVKPVRGEELGVGEIAVFRGNRYLTIHRLVWKERSAEGLTLVFRGDYNRVRERVPPAAVIARVVALEVPGRSKGTDRVVALERDALAFLYISCYALFSLVRPLLPASRPVERRPGAMGGAARSIFRGLERVATLFLPGRR
jgi:signal peptidase I